MLDKLPVELLIEIFSLLEYDNIKNVTLLNKYFNQLCKCNNGNILVKIFRNNGFYYLFDKSNCYDDVVDILKFLYKRSKGNIENFLIYHRRTSKYSIPIKNFLAKNITYFNIYHYDEIIQFSGDFPSLTHIYINENCLESFSGTLPNLVHLELNENCLKSFNGEFPNLVHLEINKNCLESFDGDFPNLTHLELNENCLESFDKNRFPNLKYIKLDNNPII